MKHTILALVAAVAVSAGSGCCHLPWGGCGSYGKTCCDGCYKDPCAPSGCACLDCLHKNRDLPRGAGGEYIGPAGPPTGAVTYPYYTTRAPRDYLNPHPMGIGPGSGAGLGLLSNQVVGH